MGTPRASRGTVAVAALLFAVPALHPLLLPAVGVPSHLLWFVHVLPVALLAYSGGARGAAWALATSAGGVAVGELAFGRGYGLAANAATVLALTVAVGATGALAAGFALAVRAMERRRQVLEEEARRARTLAEIGTVVASIAHELNNPLAAVATYADIVRGTPGIPDAAQHDLEVVTHQAQRAATIARQLLRMVRDGEHPWGIVPINHVVERALRARAPSLAAHNVSVHFDPAADLPAVTGVADQLEQVVLNLLTNAEQAMHRAHGRGRLTVTTRPDGRSIAVDVADSGPGITAEHLPRLFDAFFTTKPPGEGTGLGLAIARRIARTHGGDLLVRTGPGKGATFSLQLPVGGVGAPVPAIAEPVVPPVQPRRVLVVDDEPAVRSAVERLLTRRGHAVRSVPDGLSALALLGAEDFDAVVCDVHLGATTGMDVYRDACLHDPSLHGRFVFLTGAALRPAVTEELERAGNAVLAKPFTTNDLLGAVDRAGRTAGPAMAAG